MQQNIFINKYLGSICRREALYWKRFHSHPAVSLLPPPDPELLHVPHLLCFLFCCLPGFAPAHGPKPDGCHADRQEAVAHGAAAANWALPPPVATASAKALTAASSAIHAGKLDPQHGPVRAAFQRRIPGDDGNGGTTATARPRPTVIQPRAPECVEAGRTSPVHHGTALRAGRFRQLQLPQAPALATAPA